jgi:hypothetical protein
MLFGFGVVSMDSNFTFVLPVLYLRTAYVCETVFSFYHSAPVIPRQQALRQICEPAEPAEQ